MEKAISLEIYMIWKLRIAQAQAEVDLAQALYKINKNNFLLREIKYWKDILKLNKEYSSEYKEPMNAGSKEKQNQRC